MTRRANQSLCVVLVGGLVGLAGLPARADEPTSCVDLARMHTVIANYTNNRTTYLPRQGGTQVSLSNPPDPLVNHIPDFFMSGYLHDVDPRFEAAIAGWETQFGTAPYKGSGTTEEINDNPFGWGVKVNKQYEVFPSLGGAGTATSPGPGSIDQFAYFLGPKIKSGNCPTIASFVTPPCGSFATPFGTPPPAVVAQAHAAWISGVQDFYGTGPHGFGGDPLTTDLTFRKGGAGGDCAHGDCNSDGSTNVADILRMVNIAEGALPLSDCIAGADNSTCSGGAAAAAAGQAAVGVCGFIGTPQVLTAVLSALDGPGDANPLPAVTPLSDPCAGCVNPSTNQYDCSYCQPSCGDADCTFCETGCAFGSNPCTGCIDPDTGALDCANCPVACDPLCAPPPPSPTVDVCSSCTCNECGTSACIGADGTPCAQCGDGSCPPPSPTLSQCDTLCNCDGCYASDPDCIDPATGGQCPICDSDACPTLTPTPVPTDTPTPTPACTFAVNPQKVCPCDPSDTFEAQVVPSDANVARVHEHDVVHLSSGDAVSDDGDLDKGDTAGFFFRRFIPSGFCDQGPVDFTAMFTAYDDSGNTVCSASLGYSMDPEPCAICINPGVLCEQGVCSGGYGGDVYLCPGACVEQISGGDLLVDECVMGNSGFCFAPPNPCGGGGAGASPLSPLRQRLAAPVAPSLLALPPGVKAERLLR